MLYGNIYLIPTPLAPDTSERVINTQIKSVLSGLNYIVVENVRTSRRFLSEIGLGMRIDQISFIELNTHSEWPPILDFLEILYKGEDLGILSEAGCPGIADPGQKIVAWAHQQGINIIPLVGPSSIFLALMASGFNGQGFNFHGYLPIEHKERTDAIKSVEKLAMKTRQTQIFIETPYRNVPLIKDIVNICHSSTLFCIAAQLTSPDAFIKSMTIKEWRNYVFPDLHKKPAVFLISAE